MRLRCLTLCLVSLAASADSDAPEGPLTVGDLGVVTVVRRGPNVVVLDVRFPRGWPVSRFKDGARSQPKAELVLADANGVFYSGPAPVFVSTDDCVNDGGDWVEPVARLELDVAKLSHSLGAGVEKEKIVGLASLGKSPRKALEKKPDARTVMRVDFDGDGAPDAELRTGPTSSGCGDKLEDLDLVLTARGKSYSARCCGP